LLGIPNKMPTGKAVNESDFIPSSSNQRPSFGMRVAKDSPEAYLRVTKLKPDSEPWNAGIRAGDVIKEIKLEADADGKPLTKPERFVASDLSLEKAGEVFQRPDLDRVKLVVASGGGGSDREVELNRKSVMLLDFAELEKAGFSQEGRSWYQGRIGRLKGQLRAMQSDKVSTLRRV